MLSLFGLDLTDSFALQLFSAQDHDGSNGLDFTEFEACMDALTDILVVDVLVSMGFSRLEQTVIFALWGALLLGLMFFLFVGVQGFSQGTEFAAVVNGALPVFFSTFAWLAESTYWDGLTRRLNQVDKCILASFNKFGNKL